MRVTMQCALRTSPCGARAHLLPTPCDCPTALLYPVAVPQVLRKSLSDMQLQYVDLYLVHAPFFKDGVTMEKVWGEK